MEHFETNTIWQLFSLMLKIVPDAIDIYCHNFDNTILLLFTYVVNLILFEINLKQRRCLSLLFTVCQNARILSVNNDVVLRLLLLLLLLSFIRFLSLLLSPFILLFYYYYYYYYREIRRLIVPPQLAYGPKGYKKMDIPRKYRLLAMLRPRKAGSGCPNSPHWKITSSIGFY